MRVDYVVRVVDEFTVFRFAPLKVPFRTQLVGDVVREHQPGLFALKLE